MLNKQSTCSYSITTFSEAAEIRYFVQPESMKKAGKCLGVVHSECETFEGQTAQSNISQYHHPYP